MKMIQVKYKFQLDETAMGARAGYVTYQDSLERMEREEGLRKTGTWDQRTAFVGLLALLNHTNTSASQTIRNRDREFSLLLYSKVCHII